MATYTFETITAAQAANFSAADQLTVTTVGATALNAYVTYTPSNSSLPVNLRSSFTSTNFGPGLYGHAVSFADGSVVYVGNPNAADRYTGTAGNDHLEGGGLENGAGGADSLDGGAGNDYIYLGAGGSASGGDGDDRIQGGQSDSGGNGNDQIITSQYTRFVSGGAGDDTITSGDYIPSSPINIDAGAGNDIVSEIYSLGNDTYIGGAGIDWLVAQDQNYDLVVDLNLTTPQVVNPLTGSDQIIGFENLLGGGGNDSFKGDDGANILVGNYGNDTLSGGGGNDIIAPGSGAAVVSGGAGIDTLSFDYTYLSSTFVRSFYADLTSGSFVTYDLFGPAAHVGSISGIEIIIGGDISETIVGSGADESFYGGMGASFLEGGGGNDLLSVFPIAGNDSSIVGYVSRGSTASYLHATGGVQVSLGVSGAQTVGGGAGVDTLSGFANLLGGGFDDRLTGDGGANSIQGGAGNDTIDGGAGNDYIDGSAGNDVINGGDGFDIVTYAYATSGLNLNLGSATLNIGAGYGVDTLQNVEIIIGSEYADTFTSPANSIGLAMGGGNDILYSSGSWNTINAGEGDDIIYRTLSDHMQIGGSWGNDIVDYSRATSAIEVNISGFDELSDTLSSIETIIGSNFSDKIRVRQGDFDGGNRTVYAGTGDDTISAETSIYNQTGNTYLRGEDGNDYISGGYAFDDINGNKGNDTAAGNLGADWVVGGQGNDLLYGGYASPGEISDTGNDIVYGNLGDDTCYGGLGADTVRGGQGDDVVYGEAGNDWLSGDRGNDTITGGAGADIFHTFSGAGIDRVLDFSLAQGDRIQLDPGTTYSLSQVGSDAVINMGNGDQMILVGVTASSLTGSWIFTA